MFVRNPCLVRRRQGGDVFWPRKKWPPMLASRPFTRVWCPKPPHSSSTCPPVWSPPAPHFPNQFHKTLFQVPHNFHGDRGGPVFKIEVFHALQTQFGPSKYMPLSQNSPSKCNPKLKMKTPLEVIDIIGLPQEPTDVGHCHYKKWS